MRQLVTDNNLSAPLTYVPLIKLRRRTFSAFRRFDSRELLLHYSAQLVPGGLCPRKSYDMAIVVPTIITAGKIKSLVMHTFSEFVLHQCSMSFPNRGYYIGK